jgi:ABC-type bacteriocin/lantibiotic exporter with double-glycine peptidase domain
MVLWAPFLCSVLLGSPVSGVPEWQRPGRSAANCLYVYMKICGYPVSSYDDVTAALPIQEQRDTSLADLAAAGKRLGADITPLHVPETEIRTIPLPLIAQLNLLDVGAAGHFITVFKIETDGTVRYIDGSSGLQTACPLNQLKPALTGTVLTKSEGSPGSRIPLSMVIGGLSLGFLLAALTLKGRSG